MTSDTPVPGFRELGLSEPILEALAGVGYESPSPIQAQTIPVILGGSDVLGQAQTGTGKTAAFALPLLDKIDRERAEPQALVLVPTRELAIQVAEAFQKYAANLRGFHVLPIYGGQSYTPQLKGLKRGAHVIVGTPGRVMDHIKSGALDVSTLRFVVLDEGDEMLQMGFIDDIEWILEQAPEERQIALFSATMPAAIRRVAQKHMRDPQQITIQNRTATASKIRQRVWFVSGMHKLDALTRMLEVEDFDALLVFVRTKIETVDLAERLEARGFSAAPLNGDIPQQQREKTISRLKSGQVDIVVATDVAARGLDVERISHVVNYDIPYDAETYVHRIGRTGRAGRSGDAILFVAPRERNMLRIIERVTRSRIEPMNLPTVSDVNEHRAIKFKERVLAAVQAGDGKVFEELLQQIEREQNVPALEIAAALASLLQGDSPFLLGGRGEREDGSPAGAWPRSAANESDVAERRPDDRRRGSTDRAETPRRPEPPKRVRPAESSGSAQSSGESPKHARPAESIESTPKSVERPVETDAESAELADAADFELGAAPSADASGRDRDTTRDGTAADAASAEGGSAEVGSVEAVSTDTIAEEAASSPRASAEEDTSLDEGETSDAPAIASESANTFEDSDDAPRPRRDRSESDNGVDMETFRLEVGHVHGVLPGNIVGAIANEAGLDGKHIGHIDIREDHSYVDLPAGMPKEIFRELKKVKIRGEELRISRVDSKPPRPERTGFRPRREGGDRDFSPRAPGSRPFKRREFGSGDRPPPRRDFNAGDRPPRRDFGGDGPPPPSEGVNVADAPPKRREFGSSDRPPRREFGSGDRPPPRREFGSGDRPPPRRQFGSGDRPAPRREFGSGDRPPPRREFGAGDRPPPRREFGSGDRPPPRRQFGSGDSLPPRREFGSGGAPPPRSEFGSGDRPREFRPGKPHAMRAGKPPFSKGPGGKSKGPRKTFTPRGGDR